jgi:hypothetical protein
MSNIDVGKYQIRIIYIPHQSSSSLLNARFQILFDYKFVANVTPTTWFPATYTE